MDLYDRISDLAKRRGIIYPSFEIYGGLSGFFDYGPVGTLLKRNIENKWREMFVRREGMVEIETTIVMPFQVWEASGHLSHFTDALTTCTSCKKTYRADFLLSEAGVQVTEGAALKELDRLIAANGVACPDCGGKLGPSEPFNLMFTVTVGPFGEGVPAHCRPEAAQGQIVDFKRVYAAERERLPLGIAQIGRAARNEIAPRKGPIRLREFTIIDYEIFFDPDDSAYPRLRLLEKQMMRIITASEQEAGTNRIQEVYPREALERKLVENEVSAYFLALSVKFMEEIGVPAEKQRLRELLPDERAHYSKQTYDHEVWLERWGWTEVAGHAYRTDFDLHRHMIASGVDQRVYKPFSQPSQAEVVTLMPNQEAIARDFGDLADAIQDMIRKADPTALKREIEGKGSFELPGKHPTKLTSEHVQFQTRVETANGRSFIPHVIEPAFGVDRILYAALEYAYTEKEGRLVLRLPNDIAPVKVAVFPLVDRDDLPRWARELHERLVEAGFQTTFDESGSIGRRYARVDEIGVPLVLTVDYNTPKDRTVTVRDRDTWKQQRITIDDLENTIRNLLVRRREN